MEGLRQQGLRGGAIRPVRAVDALEQGQQRHVQGTGDAHEPPGPDAVGATLVLLHLLKRDAKLRREVGLRQALGQALDADVAADQPVDGVRRFRGHKSSSTAAGASHRARQWRNLTCRFGCGWSTAAPILRTLEMSIY